MNEQKSEPNCESCRPATFLEKVLIALMVIVIFAIVLSPLYKELAP